MTPKSIPKYKRIILSRYTHLFVGLVGLYVLSSLTTYTTPFNKITENLKRYCYADYGTQIPPLFREMPEIAYYKEKYRGRLDHLAKGMFEKDHKDEAQAYFMSNGLLYDACEDNRKRSYLLAKIIQKGVHKSAPPMEVRFDYLVLGEKKIVPFSEYQGMSGRGSFVSAGGNWIYLHRDSLEPVLRWYFESLWTTQPTAPHHFHADGLSYALYRDLQAVCEDIFIQRRQYMNKGRAEEEFVEEGFRVFLPTLLSMGARLAIDRTSEMPSDYQYLRACLTGFALNPNHTMLYLCRTEGMHVSTPKAAKGWRAFSRGVNLTYPDQITLKQISELSEAVLDSLEEPPVTN